MPSRARAVTVGTTSAVLLWKTVTGQGVTTGETSIKPATGRYRAGTFNQPLYIAVANAGTHTIYLGTSSVTTSIGVPLPRGAAPVTWSVSGEDQIWAIATGGTVSVRVLAGPAVF